MSYLVDVVGVGAGVKPVEKLVQHVDDVQWATGGSDLGEGNNVAEQDCDTVKLL